MNHQAIKIGTIISQDNSQIASLLSGLGYHFIFIDLEHGHVSDNTIASIITSKNPTCEVFIRIQSITEANIKHALDLGCDGLIAPRVENKQELQTLVDYSYYPPIGKRSVGFSLANKFGSNFTEYTTKFKPTILAQIESITGLEIADNFISHNYIDGIFLGPYDLSMSMGIPGEFDNPMFQTAVQTIRTSCKEKQKLFATFANNSAVAKQEIENGCDLIAIGVDSNIQLNAYEDIIKPFK